MALVTKHAAAVALMMAVSANAGVKDYVENKIGGSYVKTSPGYFKSEAANNYTGGGVSIRWGGSMGATSLVHIDPPKMSVGCDGIDLSFGSFSFISADELVEKMKGIGQSGAGFAFKMALSTVCKECDTIMTELENAINQINKLSLDSCGLGEALGNATGEALGKAMMTEPDQLAAQKKQQQLGWAEDVKGYVDDANQLLGGDWGQNSGKMVMGSALRNALKNSKDMLSDKEMEPFLMALYGDYYMYRSKEAKDYLTKTQTPTADPNTFVNLLMDGSGAADITGIKLSTTDIAGKNDIMKPPQYDPGESMKTLVTKWLGGSGMKGYVINKVSNLRTAINNSTALKQADIDFLSTVSFPVWRAINIEVSRTRKGQSTDLLTGDMARMIAFLHVQNFFLRTNSELMSALATTQASIDEDVAGEKHLQDFKEYAKAVGKRCDSIAKALNDYREAELKNLTTKGFHERLAKMEKEQRREVVNRIYGGRY